MKNSTILRLSGGAACGLTSVILTNTNSPSIVFTVLMILVMAYGEIVGIVDYKEKTSVQLEKDDVVSSSTTKK